MSITLAWLPNAVPGVAAYQWQRASSEEGTYEDLATVAHDPTALAYTYVDTTGESTHWYRMRTVCAWTTGFQPEETPTPLPFPNTVFLNEDYPTTNSLRYTFSSGEPVEDAIIRVYLKTDYDLGDFEHVVGQTRTNAAGGWDCPIAVDVGFTYTVEFYRPGIAGPDTQEVVVP